MSETNKFYQYDRNDNNTFGVRGAASGGGTEVVANPEGEATADLEKLQVGESIYGIPEGTNVVANPTLAGTESALTGLQVGDTKYKVPVGYTIHTYTANKTYTSADSDYQQLIDDLTNKRDFIMNDIIYKCVRTATDRWDYSSFANYLSGGNYSNNQVTFIKSGDSYINTRESFALAPVTANPSASATTPLSKLQVGDTTYGVYRPSQVLLTYNLNPYNIVQDYSGNDHTIAAAFLQPKSSAPVAANDNGFYGIYISNTEPSTKYSGYIYFITE